jgi:hypothetical protein
MLQSKSPTRRLGCAFVDASRRSLHLRHGAIFRLQAYRRRSMHLIWLNRLSFGCSRTGASFPRVTCSITMVADPMYPQLPTPLSVSRLLQSWGHHTMLPLIYHLQTHGRFLCMMFFRAESVNAAVALCNQALATRKLDFWSAAMTRTRTYDYLRPIESLFT